jgi:hypothetical protein
LTEISIFTPVCQHCRLPAVAVEHQQPFSDAAEAAHAAAQLHDIPSVRLKFYCAYHAPFSVPLEAHQRSEDALLGVLSTSVKCARHGDKRYAAICVLYMRRCVKRCQPIADLVYSVGLNWKITQASIEAAWQRREQHRGESR